MENCLENIICIITNRLYDGSDLNSVIDEVLEDILALELDDVKKIYDFKDKFKTSHKNLDKDTKLLIDLGSSLFENTCPSATKIVNESKNNKVIEYLLEKYKDDDQELDPDQIQEEYESYSSSKKKLVESYLENKNKK